MDVDDDARTIGARLRQIRNARRKSLRMVAGLAGMSKSHLSQLERGERALDSRSETVALADVLQTAPSELTRLPEPAAGNGEGPAVKAIRQALIAVTVTTRRGSLSQSMCCAPGQKRLWSLNVSATTRR